MDYQTSCATTPLDPAPCRASIAQYLTRLKSLNDLWRAGIPEERHAPLPFHVRPKCHMFEHMGADQLGLCGSPNTCHCYGDEDYMGCIKKVAAKTNHPATLEQRVLEKCRLLAGVDGYYARHPELMEVPADLQLTRV